jgi:ankyrin repeat protein
MIDRESQFIPFDAQIDMVRSKDNWEQMLEKTTLGKADSIKDRTILHIAARLGRTSFLEYFIAKGINLNVRCSSQLSVLAAAIDLPFYALRQITSQAYQRPPRKQSRSQSPQSRYHSIAGSSPAACKPFLCRYRVVERLLAAGADVNSVADDEANVLPLRHTFKNYKRQKSVLG